MNKKTKKILLLIVKLAIAVALLCWVLRTVDWAQFRETISQASIPMMLVALLGFFLSLVTIAIRLWYLLRVQEIPIGLWEIIRLTFLGQFFNAVVPGTVGGDLVKAFYAAKHTPHKGAALVTVFIDRLMGLTELAMLAGVMLSMVVATRQMEFSQLHRAAIACVAALGAVTMLMVFLFSRRFRQVFGLEKAYSKLSFAHHFESAAAAAHKFRKHKSALVAALGMSLVAHSLWIVGVIFIGKGLGIAAQWHHYFVFIPLIYIIGAVPITPGAVGLVESLYAMFFVPVVIAASGLTEGEVAAQVIALALLVRLFDIIRGLPGVIVVITGTKIPKTAAMEAELDSELESGVDSSN